MLCVFYISQRSFLTDWVLLILTVCILYWAKVILNRLSANHFNYMCVLYIKEMTSLTYWVLIILTIWQCTLYQAKFPFDRLSHYICVHSILGKGPEVFRADIGTFWSYLLNLLNLQNVSRDIGYFFFWAFICCTVKMDTE